MTDKELPKALRDTLNRSDAEIAAALKQMFAEAALPLLGVMEEARSMDFGFAWSVVGPTPPDGKIRFVNLVVVKTKVF